MVIVCKFGGTSAKDGQTLAHVVDDILLADSRRRVIVVSAQSGVTDKLIRAGEQVYSNTGDPESLLRDVRDGYTHSAAHFNLGNNFLEPHFHALHQALSNRVDGVDMFLDGVIPYGERFNAEILAAALRSRGANAKVYYPEDIGMVTDGKPRGSKLLHSSYEKMSPELKAALAKGEFVVLPGFYGIDAQGRFTTLGRGASDITGAHAAYAVDAELYENWSDQNGILKVHPDVVEKPETIGSLTCREARELAISGAKILHHDTLLPLISKNILLNVRNTNNPSHPGTYIGPTKVSNGHVVEGIAHKGDFAVIYLEQTGIEDAVGYLSQVSEIFARHGLSIERSPDSSDSLSLIVFQDKGKNRGRIEAVVSDIKKAGLVDSDVNVQYNRGLICVVGEGMRHTPGVLAKITGALAGEKINIETCIQGPSERSITIGLHPNDIHRGVRAIYSAYFGNVRPI